MIILKWSPVFFLWLYIWTVYWIVSELDTRWRFKSFYLCDSLRGSFPKELHVGGQDNFEETVPCLRSHLPPALWFCYPAAGGGAPQHLFQALYLLCSGVSCVKHVGLCLAAWSGLFCRWSFTVQFNIYC